MKQFCIFREKELHFLRKATVSADGMNPEELKTIVGDVNSVEVSEDEFLSGNVYKYIRRENRLVIA